jgi:hypothetical protein
MIGSVRGARERLISGLRTNAVEVVWTVAIFAACGVIEYQIAQSRDDYNLNGAVEVGIGLGFFIIWAVGLMLVWLLVGIDRAIRRRQRRNRRR